MYMCVKQYFGTQAIVYFENTRPKVRVLLKKKKFIHWTCIWSNTCQSWEVFTRHNL